ncbi:hypothetical protein E1162_03330 [Rhodobacteraceae bacterium RKSG542]|uniref:hypothetical protein n=1 Tax=Pseudovibrio flavus TaxID=2529854 RepID=UPI0012BD2170|nr:hypothetical protein [Pseudovibrio flavus]MTI16269.1 hypothetical protein [Pseudovibrio flavus]
MQYELSLEQKEFYLVWSGDLLVARLSAHNAQEACCTYAREIGRMKAVDPCALIAVAEAATSRLNTPRFTRNWGQRQ